MLRGGPTIRGMIVRSALVAVVTVVVVLLVSLALPALGNPLAILLAAAVTLGLTLVKDRRVAPRLAMAASVALVILAWLVSQPSYVPS